MLPHCKSCYYQSYNQYKHATPYNKLLTKDTAHPQPIIRLYEGI